MIRTLFIALLATAALDSQANAGSCHVAGTAYDETGHPLPAVVVRLVDRETGKASYRAVDANAKFEFADLSSDAGEGRYRLDMLSPATVVVGTHIRTRSVVGIAPRFSCRENQNSRVDVTFAAR